MPRDIKSEDGFILRFGGGIHSRASEDQIDPRECAEGQNFLLDPGNGEWRPRPPFDAIGTVPNAAEIRGFATLKDTAGNTSTLVQAGGVVYQWDGLTTFTQVGTVSSSAKLRGGRHAAWELDDKVIITDLNLAEEVHEWDGTTFAQTTFTDNDDGAFGTFRAKYAIVDNERVLFGNVYDNGTNYPHLLVGTKRSDYTVLTQGTGDRAGAAGVTAEEAWFLPMPQLRPINGLAQNFGVVAISQEDGAFEKLSGTDATDFTLEKLYEGSGAAGDEAIAATTNDLLYGRPGRIESLVSTDKFGDVEIDDPSFRIADSIRSYGSWTIHYNRRLHRLYCFPSGESEVWVAQVDMLRSEISPWSKWVTAHALAFQPTASQICWDPQDDLEYLLMGDSSGNVYRMEGTGLAGDAGEANVVSSRTSVQISAPLDSQFNTIHGWVKYRKNLANTLTLTLQMAGEHVADYAHTLTLGGLTRTTVYGGSVYYGGSFYYGTQFEDRFVRGQWSSSGRSNSLSVKTQIDGVNDFAIAEIGCRFDHST